MDLENFPAEKVLLSGGSGMLGRAIARALGERGLEVVSLTREVQVPEAHKAQNTGTAVHWHPASGELDPSALDRVGPFAAAVHLSGANVSSRRWTKAYKHEIWESRVTTTHVLATGLARMKQPPPVLVTASAIGFYGNRGDAVLEEDSAPGSGFFPDLCVAWEAAAKPAEDAGIRVVHLRFGVVLSPKGGALAQMLPLFRLGLGGKLGSGRQWMSWVSERDVVSAALFTLDHPGISGPCNVTAPNPQTNAEFTRELAHAVHRPALVSAPAFALRLAFGEMADEALLSSARAIPGRLIQAGFAFAHPDLAGALAEAVPHS